MVPSRQVQRAEYRAEMKRGHSIGKKQARVRQQKIRDKRRSAASTLRIAAISAVSTIKGFYRQKPAKN
jgi:hypothetical protein